MFLDILKRCFCNKYVDVIWCCIILNVLYNVHSAKYIQRIIYVQLNCCTWTRYEPCYKKESRDIEWYIMCAQSLKASSCWLLTRPLPEDGWNAVRALLKGGNRRRPGKEKLAWGTPKGRSFGKRWRVESASPLSVSEIMTTNNVQQQLLISVPVCCRIVPSGYGGASRFYARGHVYEPEYYYPGQCLLTYIRIQTRSEALRVWSSTLRYPQCRSGYRRVGSSCCLHLQRRNYLHAIISDIKQVHAHYFRK